MEGLFPNYSDDAAALRLVYHRLESPSFRKMEAWLKAKGIGVSDNTIERILANPAQPLRDAAESERLSELSSEYVPSFYSLGQRGLRRSYRRAMATANAKTSTSRNSSTITL